MKKIFISDIRWSYILSYFANGDSLFRFYQDKVLENTKNDFDGDIIELGGERHYKTERFYKNNKLIVSNINRSYDVYIDITNIHFENSTVENYLIISTLQHVDKPFLAIEEVKRTLKPGGKVLIVNAFSHPICDEKDYWRFGEDAYHVFFGEEYEIEKIFYLGGKFSMMSNILRRPIGNLSIRYLFNKCIGFFITLVGKLFERQDMTPIGIGMLVRKKI